MSPVSMVTLAYREIISFNACVVKTSLLLYVTAIMENRRLGESFV